MGMAASQARYLGLTARKTNTEYEGQQINQQRTALANQSAGLFNRMLSLEVPTPPSTQDYTKVSYTYSDGVNKETISSFTPLAGDPDYNYTVTHFHNSQVYTGIETKQVNPQVRKSGSTYTYIGNSPLTLVSVAKQQAGVTEPQIIYSGDGATRTYTSLTEGGSSRSLSAYTTADRAALEQLAALHPTSNLGQTFLDGDTSEIYRYTGSDGEVHYVCKDDLDASIGSTASGGAGMAALDNYTGGDTTSWAAVNQIVTDNASSQFAEDAIAGDDIYSYQLGGVTYYVCESDLDASYNSIIPNGAFEGQSALNRYNSAYLDTRVETTEKAFLQQDQSGRFISAKLENSSPTFTLGSSTITDDNAYNDAMNQYNYNTFKYQKEIEDINAKTKIIQEEDRTLELRLKQLDTEQKALQTEMEAVKKVIDKNVEMTFKTFSS